MQQCAIINYVAEVAVEIFAHTARIQLLMLLPRSATFLIIVTVSFQLHQQIYGKEYIKSWLIILYEGIQPSVIQIRKHKNTALENNRGVFNSQEIPSLALLIYTMSVKWRSTTANAKVHVPSLLFWYIQGEDDYGCQSVCLSILKTAMNASCGTSTDPMACKSQKHIQSKSSEAVNKIISDVGQLAVFSLRKLHSLTYAPTMLNAISSL